MNSAQSPPSLPQSVHHEVRDKRRGLPNHHFQPNQLHLRFDMPELRHLSLQQPPPQSRPCTPEYIRSSATATSPLYVAGYKCRVAWQCARGGKHVPSDRLQLQVLQNTPPEEPARAMTTVCSTSDPTFSTLTGGVRCGVIAGYCSDGGKFFPASCGDSRWKSSSVVIPSPSGIFWGGARLVLHRKKLSTRDQTKTSNTSFFTALLVASSSLLRSFEVGNDKTFLCRRALCHG